MTLTTPFPPVTYAVHSVKNCMVTIGVVSVDAVSSTARTLLDALRNLRLS